MQHKWLKAETAKLEANKVAPPPPPAAAAAARPRTARPPPALLARSGGDEEAPVDEPKAQGGLHGGDARHVNGHQDVSGAPAQSRQTGARAATSRLGFQATELNGARAHAHVHLILNNTHTGCRPRCRGDVGGNGRCYVAAQRGRIVLSRWREFAHLLPGVGDGGASSAAAAAPASPRVRGADAQPVQRRQHHIRGDLLPGRAHRRVPHEVVDRMIGTSPPCSPATMRSTSAFTAVLASIV